MRKKTKHLRNSEKKNVFFIFRLPPDLFFAPAGLILYPVRKGNGGNE